MTCGEFCEAVVSYYGAFENETVAVAFGRYSSKVRQSDLARVFDWLIENIAASWRIDVKTLIDACRVLQVPMQKPTAQCACCGNVYEKDKVYCPVCLYDPNGSGSVEEYRAFYEDWQKDRSKYIARIGECLNPLTLHKKYEFNNG